MFSNEASRPVSSKTIIFEKFFSLAGNGSPIFAFLNPMPVRFETFTANTYSTKFWSSRVVSSGSKSIDSGRSISKKTLIWSLFETFCALNKIFLLSSEKGRLCWRNKTFTEPGLIFSCSGSGAETSRFAIAAFAKTVILLSIKAVACVKKTVCVDWVVFASTVFEDKTIPVRPAGTPESSTVKNPFSKEAFETFWLADESTTLSNCASGMFSKTFPSKSERPFATAIFTALSEKLSAFTKSSAGELICALLSRYCAKLFEKTVPVSSRSFAEFSRSCERFEIDFAADSVPPSKKLCCVSIFCFKLKKAFEETMPGNVFFSIDNCPKIFFAARWFCVISFASSSPPNDSETFCCRFWQAPSRAGPFPPPFSAKSFEKSGNRSKK